MRSFSVVPIVALGLGLGLSARPARRRASDWLASSRAARATGLHRSMGGIRAEWDGPAAQCDVYVPNAPVEAFPPGVSCPISGSPPSGSPLVGTITDVKGKFSLVDMPVGANIPIVAVSGRWRVKSTVNTVACSNTAMNLSMPQNRRRATFPRLRLRRARRTRWSASC